MPSLFRTFGLALLMATASGALVNPTPHPDVPAGISARDTTGGALNPMKGGTRPLEYAMTNGQRLARGLPPNKPHHRRQGRSPVLSPAKCIFYTQNVRKQIASHVLHRFLSLLVEVASRAMALCTLPPPAARPAGAPNLMVT